MITPWVTGIFILLSFSEILEDSYRNYRIERNEEWVPIVKFSCHGLEPTDFDFDYENGWSAGSLSSKARFDVDMELDVRV